MLVTHFLTVFAIFVQLIAVYGNNIIDLKRDTKRQVTLSDIIQGALNFVRPIIGTPESMQSDFMASRKFRSEQIKGRDAEILGLPKYSVMDDMPICKSNSKICKFITCTARNFQNDKSIMNLNLAAQMLADKKLRKMIASDPSILLTSCQEQGLSPAQCKLFANAFQFIDRFIATIEPLEADSKRLQRYVIKDDPYYDDSDAPPVPIQPGMYQNIGGSQTWSSNERNINDSELLKEKQNLSGLSEFSHPVTNLLNPFNFPNQNNHVTPVSMESMLKTISLSTTSVPLPTFPPLIFTFPTPATIAPMIAHPSPPVGFPAGFKLDVPSSSMNLMTAELQVLMPQFNNNMLLPNIMSPPLSPVMLPEPFKPINSAGSIRKKRSDDYYENIEEENDESRSTNVSIHDKTSDNNQQMIKLQKQTIDQKGLIDCMKLLEEN
ncbi:hypothetical protein X798_04903 [Onchocerca flexuosa]|uniref:Uncharacterized protein n=1 Tax=Onchocerca flexuosa TaxID=387005 RepID=A0A238BTW1_9BILA|nr:hypothetical protein X798_04903 [Onchocerca flexuosa]